jgi:hypothetical protein
VFVNLTALRGEQSVDGIILQISSSAPGIVSACGSVSTCEAQNGWLIVSVSPGDAEITVSARNLTTGFTMHVVEAP